MAAARIPADDGQACGCGLRIERRVGTRRAALAGGRHRGGARRRRLDHRLAHRPLAGEQVLDLVARQRLEFEQALGERLEVGALLGRGCLLRLGIAGLDQPADLGVDLAARLLRDVLLARHRIAEEHLFLVLAIGDRAELLGQAPARHHHARELGRLLDVGRRAGGDALARRTPAPRRRARPS